MFWALRKLYFKFFFLIFDPQDDDESLDFTLKADEEDSIDFQEPIMDSLKEVKSLENI